MKVVVANSSECWYVNKQVHGVTSHKTVITMSLGMLMENKLLPCCDLNPGSSCSQVQSSGHWPQKVLG
jgi:hypothetical protein